MTPQPASALHHHALRVADVRRAGDFYCALGGDWLTMPITIEGPAVEQAVGMSGVRVQLAMIAFRGGALELFEFLEPAIPDWARTPTRGTIPHLALQVEDVEAVLTRAEAAGGRRLWPAIDRVGPARGIYIADPDGNVVELLDRRPEDIAAAIWRWLPHAIPGENA